MGNALRGGLVGLAVLIGTVVMPPTPAHAATAMAVTFDGQGTIQPGLDATLQPRNWQFNTFAGLFVGVLHDQPIADLNPACDAVGMATLENIAFGFGFGAFQCITDVSVENGNVAYMRVGTQVVLQVQTAGYVGMLGCVFTPLPLTAIPVNQFSLVCRGAVAGPG
jgi:hypothetical protein